jgi:predicted transcriptional regulator
MANKKRKWMAALEDRNYDWVKETSEQTGVSGSAIINALIERESKDKSFSFRSELAQERLKIELQRLNDKQAELENQKQELARKMKGNKVAVPA